MCVAELRLQDGVLLMGWAWSVCSLCEYCLHLSTCLLPKSWPKLSSLGHYGMDVSEAQAGLSSPAEEYWEQHWTAENRNFRLHCSSATILALWMRRLVLLSQMESPANCWVVKNEQARKKVTVLNKVGISSLSPDVVVDRSTAGPVKGEISGV